MSTTKPKKTLVLHVTVPGFWADDLDECARELADTADPPLGHVCPRCKRPASDLIETREAS